VAGDDAVLTVDQHGIGPAEFSDAGCDLRHLSIAMRARIAGIRDQLAQRPPGDGKFIHDQDLTKRYESTCF
jgi:hypothetical protein